MKFEIYKFNNVTSTNDMAINLIREENKISGCVYANKQTKGRGTKGKKWISDEGNFFGSIFFPLENDYPPFNEFSIINPVIISNVIKNFCEKKNISVKWPNDIFVNKKKICGILQELITLNGKKFLIIGKQINNLIKSSYEKFFIDLNNYSYLSFKKKADLITVNWVIE